MNGLFHQKCICIFLPISRVLYTVDCKYHIKKIDFIYDTYAHQN